MKKNENDNIKRRKFIKKSALALAGLSIAGDQIIGAPDILKYYNKPSSLLETVQIGVITYSYRSMPDQSAEATLQYILNSGVHAIELMGDPAETFAGRPENPVDRRAFFALFRKQRSGEELTEDEQKQMADMRTQMEAHNKEVAEWRSKVAMEPFTKMKKMYEDAGVRIYGFKASAFGQNNSDAEIDYGFRAAKALGASHVTLEHPSDDAQTKKLGNMAKKHGIYVAYHGHEQQTPTFWDTALEQSEYNAMNPDIGHYVAAGNTDTLGLLKKYRNRIMSIHLKDRKTPENGKDNVTWGTGDTPIAEALQMMKKEEYTFPATIELEYPIPDGSDAVEEVKKCLEYCRKVVEF